MLRLRRWWAAVGARGPWIVSAAVLFAVGPAIVRRALDVPYGEGRGGYALVLITCAMLCVAALSVLRVGPRFAPRPARPFRRLAVFAVFGALVLAGVFLLTRSDFAWWAFHGVVGVLGPFVFVVAAALVAMIATLRRRGLSDRHLAVRISSSALVLASAGTLAAWTGAGFSWACFSPIVSAEAAGWASAEALPAAVLTGAMATAGLVVAIASRVRVARPRIVPMFPLIALALILGGRTVTDGIACIAATVVAEGAHGAAPDAATVERLATWADLIGAATTTIAVVLSLVAGALAVAMPRARRSAMPVLRAVWPVLPLALVLGSPALEPHLVSRFPQQSPEAVWREIPDFEPMLRAHRAPDDGSDDDGFAEGRIPFFQTRTHSVVSGVLPATGDLVLYRDGRSETYRWDDIADAPGDHFWGAGVDLVVDRRVTLGRLRSASSTLRRFQSISVAWLSSDLSSAQRASARWGFVDMASRALRARTIRLVTSDAGRAGPVLGDARARRSEGEHPSEVVMLDESDGALPLEALLRSNSSRRVELALSVPAVAESDQRVRGIGDVRTARDPVLARWAPRDARWVLIGVVIAVLLVLGLAQRDLARLRALERTGVAGEASSALPIHPRWARRRLATLVTSSGASSTYRTAGNPRGVAFPTSARAARELARLARSGVRAVSSGAMRWTLLAVIATLAGFAVAALPY